MTREEIREARVQVPTLYLTEDGREIIAPGNQRGAIVDPQTNQIAWKAYQCENPNCPGEGKGDRPFVFPRPHPLLYVNEEGKIAARTPKTKEDFEQFDAYAEAKCPACLKIRDLKSETDEERHQYNNWVEPYVLPEAEERLEELEAEHERYLEYLRELETKGGAAQP